MLPMRCAIALFVFLLTAPIALFCNPWLSGSPTLPEEAPRPRWHVARAPDFQALCREHQMAVRDYEQQVKAAGPDADPATLAELDPARQFFPRFLALAEKHAGDYMAPLIVKYALVHCGGPHISHEQHMQIKAVLEHAFPCPPQAE
jgi:hypothetical protein